MTWVNLHSDNADLWRYVSLYESFDYVADLYSDLHNTTPDDIRIREINASFEQGRMYFHNARSAPHGVKPLLLYYGALSLCGGLTLLKNRSISEMSRSPSHGLSPKAWKDTLKRDVRDVLHLKIAIGRGAFAEFTNVCWNKNITAIRVGDNLFQALQSLGPLSLPGIADITLGQLIARSRYCGLYYPTVTGEQPRMHEVNLGRDLIVHANPTWKYQAQLADYGRKKDAIVDEKRSQPVALGFNDTKHEPLIYCDPSKASSSRYAMYLVEDLACGNRPNELIKLYLISYILGMLSRYFPSRWMSIIRNDQTARARPLLFMAIEAVETSFVAEFSPQIAVLSGDKTFFGEYTENLRGSLVDWDTEAGIPTAH